eukprot:SAG11_NODE_24227_length_376_cov_1.303249_1_plen_30_part_01
MRPLSGGVVGRRAVIGDMVDGPDKGKRFIA